MKTKTLFKFIEVLKTEDSAKIANYLEDFCFQFEHLQNKEWASRFNRVDSIKNNNLPVPRIELRWRDEYFLYQDKRNSVADIGIVYQLGYSTRFDVTNSTITTDLKCGENLYLPFRAEQEMYALMYQLNMPAIVSYKENYIPITFPKEKNKIPPNVLKIMKKEDLNKLN